MWRGGAERCDEIMSQQPGSLDLSSFLPLHRAGGELFLYSLVGRPSHADADLLTSSLSPPPLNDDAPLNADSSSLPQDHLLPMFSRPKPDLDAASEYLERLVVLCVRLRAGAPGRADGKGDDDGACCCWGGWELEESGRSSRSEEQGEVGGLFHVD